MKRSFVFALAVAILASCSTREIDIQTPAQEDVVFFASFEQPGDEGTKVYANEDLLLRWTADDRVSIFNKLTYNQEYKFTGQTGANAGGFKKVDNDEFVTGNALSHVVSVYPYQEATSISEDEVISLTLPAEQAYAENTFGLGANTMVSVSTDNVLQYKNVGGYLMLKLYGEGVSISSITLKGNNGEKLAGKATVAMPLDGVPSVVMANDATTEITLVCKNPILLGANADECTQFWFVVPPMTFEKGFAITVKDDKNGVFEKSTTKSFEISRNKLAKMSAIEVILGQSDEAIVFADDKVKAKLVAAFDTNGDGELSYAEAASITSCGDLRSAFDNLKTFTSFDEFRFFTGITEVSANMFVKWASLSSISLPSSIKKIQYSAFEGCILLHDIVIPEGVTFIGMNAFRECQNLETITLPNSLETILNQGFYKCSSLKRIHLPTGCSLYSGAFADCESLEIVDLPDDLTIIPASLFSGCKQLSNIALPNSLSEIRDFAFSGCNSLQSIISLRNTPPTGGSQMFINTNNCPIYVPASSVDAYKTAQYWSDYADRIYAIGTPMAVDLGLSVKWASFNLGASKPEEYGDYYAWGETEPYYSSQDPLTWSEGKTGYSWGSYKWCMGSGDTMTKYCSNSEYGYNSFTDNKIVLDPEDDVAHVNLGGNWRMPTDSEWTELRENCTRTCTTQNGVYGRLFTASNGNSIFLPVAGFRDGSFLVNVGSSGYYWSSSLYTGIPYNAWYVNFDSSNVYRSSHYRHLGFSVRSVYAE